MEVEDNQTEKCTVQVQQEVSEQTEKTTEGESKKETPVENVMFNDDADADVSQESSVGLVIDENATAEEEMDLDEECENASKTNAEDSKTDEVGEFSASTQIDVALADKGALQNNGGDLVKDEIADLTSALVKVPNETESVEVSDDDEVEAQEKEKPKDPTVNEKVVNSEKGITLIEIDDEEEDDGNAETKKIETENKATENTSNTVENTASTEVEKNETVAIVPKDVDEVAANSIDKSKDTENEQIPVSVDACDTGTDMLLQEAPAPPRELTPEPKNEEHELESTENLVYTNKECINHECPRTHKQYFRAPQFALSQYKIAKKKFKRQYICSDCYDQILNVYEEYCGILKAKQPLLLKDIIAGRQEFVEIIDSSDEEDNNTSREIPKDNVYLCKNDLKLLEDELESTIQNTIKDVEIQNQLTWCKTILSTRLNRISEENIAIEEEIRVLQKKADQMHTSLYQCPKIKLRQLQPLDLNTGRMYSAMETIPVLPPIGEIQRLPIQLNETYYAVKNKAIASWVPCKVIEPMDSGFSTQKNLKYYKVKFLKSQYSMLKTVSDKHMAYFDSPNVQLPIGTRVIAYFDASSLSRGKEKMTVQSAFYPGIIAEPLKISNRFRYLIFYDDGYTQYVHHDDVRLVCHVSENVWEDVHPGSRDFIQKYLTQYSINRPMVQTQKGQSMATESNGKWNYARVIDIDCSLIQMQFEGPKSHTEWIYRGSLRLGPVFKEYQKTMQKDAMPTSRLPRRTEPFIRYTEDEETSTNQQQQHQHQQRERTVEARAVARKSVSRQEPTSGAANSVQAPTIPIVRHLNNSTIYVEDENKPKGKVVYYTAKRHMPPRIYKTHRCSPACLFKISHNLNSYSPLSKPLLSGWERLIMRQKIKRVIAYRSPCGLILRNMKDLHDYLLLTENILNVDNFDFSPEIQCLAEYVIESAFVSNRDISEGQENMAIPLVNYYDNTMPQDCKYSAKRIPTEGVNLNLDLDFLVGCDCKDDCSDKEKCSCWQLTYAGAKYGNPNTPTDEIGYQYRRLYEHVPTGIYECNSRCKCKSNCLNRVAQLPLQMKLQVFKTSNRGWGLRGLNDIPRGSFICIYAGHLLTEAKANEGGLDAGDEYFAELDYIEVAEQIKEGYESDVEPLELEEEDETYAPDHDDDDDEFTPNKTYMSRSKKTQKISTNRSNQDTDSQERQVINFNPNTDMSENSLRESSIRTLFGKDEACYVMDAKITGNLGRYFNHSCSPNLFVQNVFVDTHDLRFPWVAFFAMTNIRAGTELTWNYNYEVGVVPGKVLYCECGAPNCRLRLL